MIAAEQHHGNAGGVVRDPFSGLDTGTVRHMDVEEHDVGDQLVGALVCLAAGRHLGHDDVAQSVQQVNEQRTRVVVVFREKHADGVCCLLSHRWHGNIPGS